jgi:O-antigen ligase
MYVTGSNGALTALLGGAAALGLGRYLRGGRTREQVMALVGAAILTGVLVIGVVVSLVGIPSIGRTDVDVFARAEQQGALAYNVGRLDRGVDDRLAIWSAGWRSAAPRLAIGVGPGQATIDVGGLTGLPYSLHNDLLAYIVERGVLGVVGYLMLQAILLGWSGRLLGAEGSGRGTYRGLAAAVVANLVFSMSHETMHFRHVWVLYAMVAAAILVLSARERTAEARALAPATASR